MLLEVARLAKSSKLPYELRLVFFGGEERTTEQPEVHHVGSDTYVSGLNEAERQRIAAMVSVDMVAGKPSLAACRVGFGSDRARQWLLQSGERLGVAMRTDTGKHWSDHEAFELAAIPSVWLASLPEGEHWHSTQDVPGRINQARLAEALRVVLRFLRTAGEGLG